MTRTPAIMPAPFACASLAAVIIVSSLLASGCASVAPARPRANTSSPTTTLADTAPNTGPNTDGILNPSDVIISSGPWDFRGVEGIAVRTPSYEVFTTERTALLRDRLPMFMELALAEYRTALGNLPAPAQPMRTFLMDNRPQWEQLTRAIAGQRADIFLRIERGGFAYETNGVFFDIGLRDTLNIAAHEGWHQYTQTVFQTPLPVYLEEGIAAYMEGFRWDASSPRRPTFQPWANTERFDQLRDAYHRGRLIPLDELLVARPQDLLETRGPQTLDYYAQVWALIHFLREGAQGRYAQGLEDALQEASTGAMTQRIVARFGAREARASLLSRRGAAVFATYLDDDIERADEDYQQFIRALVRPGARDAITQGRSPFEL